MKSLKLPTKIQVVLVKIMKRLLMQSLSQQAGEEHEHKPYGSDLQPVSSTSSIACSTSATASSGVSVSNVQSIRQTIQDTQIEPVISFQYHSEGTTASTISVDFQATEGIHCLPSTSDVGSSEVEAAPCTTASGSNTKLDTGDVHKELACEE